MFVEFAIVPKSDPSPRNSTPDECVDLSSNFHPANVSVFVGKRSRSDSATSDDGSYVCTLISTEFTVTVCRFEDYRCRKCERSGCCKRGTRK